jgi:CheY-like chemotaxis protein
VIVPAVQAVPINSVFQAVNQMFASRADKKGLQLRLRASQLWVRTDPELLQRLLVNLVENAIKYTPQGGVLVVARARAEAVWIEVCDTGIGIAPEHLAHIFDEFYQVDNPGRDRTQGLGIGLSIVRRLSVLLSHPVQVISRPGHGSHFRAVLTAAQPQEPHPAPAGDAAGDRRALPKRVLLIDDEAAIGEAVAALMATYGVGFQAVRDEAQAALALAAGLAQAAPFDALICDFRLADGADGLDTAQRLRQRFDLKLPLLLVTGETAPDRLQRVRDCAVPVLFKPVAAQALMTALASLRRTV